MANLPELRKEMEALVLTFYKETGVAIRTVSFQWADVTYTGLRDEQVITKTEFTMT
jgi:ABC-type thiamine transport system ATPase subunit